MRVWVKMSLVAAAVALGLSAASFTPGATMHVAPRVSMPAVEMNTQYTVAAGIAKKKNKKSGDPRSLMGYTVGSRAPVGAKSSGTVRALNRNKQERSIAAKLQRDTARDNSPPFVGGAMVLSILAVLAQASAN